MRDQRYENFLKAQRVQYAFLPAVPLTEIDREASLNNQARLSGVRLDEDRAETIALALMEGTDLPCLAAYRRNNRYILIDGNHRLHAHHIAGSKTVELFVVEANDDYRIEVLTRCWNSIEGQGQGAAERLAQARAVILKYKYPAAQVARDFGIDPRKLNDYLREQRAVVRLEGLGFAAKQFESASTIEAIASLPNDPVAVAFAKVVIESRMPSAAVSSAVADLRQLRSESVQMAFVQKMNDRPDIVERKRVVSRGTVRPRWTKKAALLKALTALNGLLITAPDLASLQITNVVDREQVQDLATSIIGQLQRLCGAGGMGHARSLQNRAETGVSVAAGGR